jgi:hypothetical protein
VAGEFEASLPVAAFVEGIAIVGGKLEPQQWFAGLRRAVFASSS